MKPKNDSLDLVKLNRLAQLAAQIETTRSSGPIVTFPKSFGPGETSRKATDRNSWPKWFSRAQKTRSQC